MRTNMERRRGEGKGGVIGAVFAIGLAILLAFTNPTETDMRQRAAKDGWVPVGFERTNLVVFNFVRVNGFTGAKTTYVGVLGNIFEI